MDVYERIRKIIITGGCEIPEGTYDINKTYPYFEGLHMTCLEAASIVRNIEFIVNAVASGAKYPDAANYSIYDMMLFEPNREIVYDNVFTLLSCGIEFKKKMSLTNAWSQREVQEHLSRGYSIPFMWDVSEDDLTPLDVDLGGPVYEQRFYDGGVMIFTDARDLMKHFIVRIRGERCRIVMVSSFNKSPSFIDTLCAHPKFYERVNSFVDGCTFSADYHFMIVYEMV